MNVTVLFFSTNRLEYLVPTLKSFEENIDFSGCNVNKIFIDDYPKDRDNSIFQKIKKDYNIDELILHEQNQGQSVTWKEAWSVIPESTNYIWHQEDDFIFPKKIIIRDLIDLIQQCPVTLSQVCLKRQVWYTGANDFIKRIESGEVGEEIEFPVNGVNKKIILHQDYFNANPCLYPAWVTREKYSFNPQESVIANDFKQRYGNSVYSAIYGARQDEHLSHHIGHYTQGQKVSENEPGWDWLKDYDPNKKYYSRGHLSEYTEE
tara:strand:+ start:7961 stop:8746 length:786 start_codon:yes stop_codon:yes gene_type:complete